MAIRAVQGAVFQRLHSPHSDDPIGVELVLYHDVLCSWCYVADARLDYLRDEYGPALRWSLRPYPLRPENQFPDRKQRSVLARHLRRLGREQEGKGVTPDLWTGQDPPASSVPPLVALEAALPQGQELQRELLKAMRRAAFLQGINVARRDVQLELAARVGLELGRFLEQLDDPRLEQDVNDAVEEAEALVIRGEWLMQGCRELSEYRQVIDKYLSERVAAAQLRIMH